MFTDYTASAPITESSKNNWFLHWGLYHLDNTYLIASYVVFQIQILLWLPDTNPDNPNTWAQYQMTDNVDKYCKQYNTDSLSPSIASA